MSPSKRPALFPYLFAFLTLLSIHLSPQAPPLEKQSIHKPPVPAPAPQFIQAQTGRSEVLEAIVPLERLNNARLRRSVATGPQQSREPAEVEETKFTPAVQKFIDLVIDGEAGTVRGVYIPGVLTIPVIQQPKGNAAFVSEENETVTQFQSAAQYGVTGLLAHNYLSGEVFYNIKIGQEVVIVMGDGSTRRYIVEGIYQFKKISPNNLRSILVDLSTGDSMTTSQVFSRFYRGDHKVTFQTCLEREGKLNWGLTFIVALPLAPGK